MRVGYVFLKEYGVVLLLIAYAKGEKDDLTPSECAKIKELIDRIRWQFDHRTIT